MTSVRYFCRAQLSLTYPSVCPSHSKRMTVGFHRRVPRDSSYLILSGRRRNTNIATAIRSCTVRLLFDFHVISHVWSTQRTMSVELTTGSDGRTLLTTDAVVRRLTCPDWRRLREDLTEAT